MPTVQISRKALDRIVGRSLSEEQLREALVRLGPGVDAMDKDMVTVEAFANRPDMLSEAGIGRLIAGLLDIKPGLRRYEARRSGYRVVVSRDVAKVRPKTACAVVTGVEFDDERIREIIQMQEKLHLTFCRNRRKAAIGIYPLERIKWPIRFEARKPQDIRFVPLGVGREMTGTQILSTHPAGRDYAHLLEGLDHYPVFVDAAGNILSMPPIINSEMTGKVTTDTRDVFIECSGFDQDVLDMLLNIICCALADAGGVVHAVEVHYQAKRHVTPTLKEKAVAIDIDYINKRLGLELRETEVKRLLGRMGIGYSGRKAIVPPYRADIIHQIDIAEEVMVAYGLDNLEPQKSSAATAGAEDPATVFRSRVADLLTGCGLLEASTYNIDNIANQTTRCGVQKHVVQLANALTADYNALRAWMMPSLLGVLRGNKHRDFPQRLFTMGAVFAPSKTAETRIAEGNACAVTLSHARADFTEARQLGEYILRMLDLQFTVDDADAPWAIEGRAAQLKIGTKVVATLGEIRPEVLQRWELEMPTAVVELDLDALYAAIKAK
jgi:phenylalanyl-tRNA synthetase beta chain